MSEFAAKSPFVGRDNEKRELLEALDHARAGRGRLILVAGEPGIGKSRLCEEAVAAANSRGFEVASGASWEAGGASAYWPWTQIARHCSERQPGKVPMFGGYDSSPDPATRSRALNGHSSGTQDAEHAPAPQTAGDQFYFFDTFAEAIRNFAVTTGLLIVLEDLHAADPDSILLSQFVARRIQHSPILMLATYREREVRADSRIAALVQQLGREGRTIRLRGFGTEEIKELVRQYDKSGRVEDHAIEELRRTTEGNPFFLNEILAHLRATGRSLNFRLGSGVPVLPDSARIAIESRLARLPQQTVEILRVASVFGREFDAGLLGWVCETGRDALLPSLDAAEAAGIVSRFGGSSGRYLFDHFLLTQVLYEQLPTGRREFLHHLIAEMLESRQKGTASESQLAHHYFRALPQSAEKAFRYSLESGNLAMRSFAYVEATRLYQMALSALDATAEPDRNEVGLLLLKLGKAQCLAHEFDNFKLTFLKAAVLARELKDVELFAHAALGYGMAGKKDFEAQDFTTTGLLREALTAEQSLSPALRSLLLSRLAEELRWSIDAQSLLHITEEAVDTARSANDSHSLIQALHIRFQCLRGWPEKIDERLALTAEMEEVAERDNLHEWLFRARYHRASALLESGKREFYSEVNAIRQIPEPMRLFTQGLSFVEVCDALTVTLALIEGRFEEAERVLLEALGRGRDRPDFAASYFAGFFGLQMILLRREQGRTGELEESLQRAASEPHNFVARAALGHFCAESGKRSEATTHFDILAASNFEGLARDLSWSISVAYLAETCAALKDAARARILFDIVRPCSGRHALLGVVIYMGAFDYYLGLLAQTFGDPEAAKEYFRRALETQKTFNARPWIARTQLHYGRLLASTTDSEDCAKASELLSAALGAAEPMGMRKLARDCDIRSSEPEIPKRSPRTQESTKPGQTCLIRKEHDFWRLSFDGNSHTLRDRKGLSYVAHLLRNPGFEFASTQLASALLNLDGTLSIILQLNGGSKPLEGAATLGDAGEILDMKARADYKRRIDELRAEIDEAERFNDIGRVEGLRMELDLIEDQIRGAVGLHGRQRRANSHEERARVKVTNAIKSAIDALESVNPRIAGYLKNTIKTGAFCSYTPDINLPFDWSF